MTPAMQGKDAKGGRLLLHTCCGPCATHCVETARQQGHEVTLFFSNSNIRPAEEYTRRLDAARRLARECAVPLIEDTYNHSAWLAFIEGLEEEAEGGERCAKCFEFNLARTAACALEEGFTFFSTTLTVSPHKSSPKIFSIAEPLGSFLKLDFKKQGGFRRSVELSKELNLYRQTYCGCEFSMR